MCLATPPGYAPELVARCHLERGHPGNHTADRIHTTTGPADSWANDESEAA